MGSNNDTNRDSPEKMLRYAEAELTDLLKSQRELTKQRAIHLVKVYAALDRIEKSLENRRKDKLIRCFGWWYDITREKTSEFLTHARERVHESLEEFQDTTSIEFSKDA